MQNVFAGYMLNISRNFVAAEKFITLFKNIGHDIINNLLIQEILYYHVLSITFRVDDNSDTPRLQVEG